jgi:hypothetical protein
MDDEGTVTGAENVRNTSKYMYVKFGAFIKFCSYAAPLHPNLTVKYRVVPRAC